MKITKLMSKIRNFQNRYQDQKIKNWLLKLKLKLKFTINDTSNK